MSDSITGVKITPPTYPVKPAQPAERDGRQENRQEDRHSGKRRKDTPDKIPAHDVHVDDDENKPVIDEYV